MTELIVSLRIENPGLLAELIEKAVHKAISELMPSLVSAVQPAPAPAPPPSLSLGEIEPDIGRPADQTAMGAALIAAGVKLPSAEPEKPPTDAVAPPEPVPIPPPAVNTSTAPTGNATRYTHERLVALASMRAGGANWPEIHRKLNALPGLPIASADSVMVKYYDLKKTGRLVDLIESAPPATRNSAAQGNALKKAASTPVKVSYETALHWAGERGLCCGGEPLDMVKVNAKRVALGFAPFEINSRAGRSLS